MTTSNLFIELYILYFLPSHSVQVARFLSEEVRPILEPYKAKMDVKIELEL